MRNITVRNAQAFALITVAVGCSASAAPTDREDVQQARAPLFVASNKVWSSHSIPVCWETAGDDTEKGWVRDAIERTWGTETAVTFSGWGTCNDTALHNQAKTGVGPGIRINTGNVWPRTSALGSDLNQVLISNGGYGGPVVTMPNFMWLNFDMAAFVDENGNSPWPGCGGASREGCTRSTAVHEFGHALGFAHEQNRGDTPASCADAPQGPNGDTNYGPWDLTSIMNYCNPQWNNDGQLSATDIAGASQYYGGPRSISSVVLGNQISAFYRGIDGALYREWHEPGFGWRLESLGGYITSDPAAVAWTNSDGTPLIDVYARGGSDGALFGNRWYGNTKSWSGWFPLGGLMIGSPAAVSWGPGVIHVFVRGTDNKVYYRSYDAGSDTWDQFRGPLEGGAITSTPSAVSLGSGLLDVFARMSDGSLGHMRWDGGAWQFLPKGGVLYGSPAAVVDPQGSTRIHVFVTGTDYHVYRMAESWNFDDTWSWKEWEHMGGPIHGSPSASSWGNNRIDLYVRGIDDRLSHWKQQLFSLPWDPGEWDTPGASFYGTPSPVTQFGFISVFLRSTEGGLHNQWWNGTAWSGDIAFGGAFN